MTNAAISKCLHTKPQSYWLILLTYIGAGCCWNIQMKCFHEYEWTRRNALQTLIQLPVLTDTGRWWTAAPREKAQLFFQWVSLSFIPVVRRQWGVKQKTLNPKHLLMDTRLNPGLIVLGSQGRVTPDQMMRQEWGRERAPIEPMHMEMSPNDQFEIPRRKKASM